MNASESASEFARLPERGEKIESWKKHPREKVHVVPSWIGRKESNRKIESL